MIVTDDNNIDTRQLFYAQSRGEIRFGPAKATGEARFVKTGSVSTFSP